MTGAYESRLSIGVDAGGSSTKIVVISRDEEVLAAGYFESHLPDIQSAARNLLSTFGANPGDITSAALTGIGALSLPGLICGIPVNHINEYSAIGLGALKLLGLSRALVMSIGTGTCLVFSENGSSKHLGGSGVGGGTLRGLSRKLFGIDDIMQLSALADNGSLKEADIFIGDHASGLIPGLPSKATASNLGAVTEKTPDADLAKAVLNMIYQTTGTLAVMAGRSIGNPDIVVTGALADLPQAEEMLSAVGRLYGSKFIIAPDPIYATAIGAALHVCHSDI